MANMLPYKARILCKKRQVMEREFVGDLMPYPISDYLDNNNIYNLPAGVTKNPVYRKMTEVLQVASNIGGATLLIDLENYLR